MWSRIPLGIEATQYRSVDPRAFFRERRFPGSMGVAIDIENEVLQSRDYIWFEQSTFRLLSKQSESENQEQN